MFEYRIQDSEQFAHAGGESHLLGFARCTEALVEVPNDKVMACSDQGRHIENGSYGSPSTPNCALASEGAAITIKGGHSDKGRDLFTIQSAQFGEMRQQGGRENRANGGDAFEKIVLLSPDRALADSLPQFSVDVSQLAFKPKNVGLDSLSDGLDPDDPETIALRGDHLDHLMPEGEDGCQFLGLEIGERTGCWLDSTGEIGQNPSVDRVGLSQPARGFGEVSHLTRIDHCQRNICHSKAGSQRQFDVFCDLQNHHGRRQLSEKRECLSNPFISVSESQLLSRMMFGHVDLLFGNVDFNECFPFLHGFPPYQRMRWHE